MAQKRKPASKGRKKPGRPRRKSKFGLRTSPTYANKRRKR